MQDAIFYRVMDKDLEKLKQKKAYEDGEKVGEDKREKEIAKKMLMKYDYFIIFY